MPRFLSRPRHQHKCSFRELASYSLPTLEVRAGSFTHRSFNRNIFVSFDNIVYHQCLYSGPNFVESKWSNFRAHVLFHVDPGTNSSPLNLQLATVSRDLMMMKASEDHGFTGLGKPKPPGISVGSCAQGAMKDGKERQQWSCTLQRALHRGSVAFLTITQKEERIQAKLSS